MVLSSPPESGLSFAIFWVTAISAGMQLCAKAGPTQETFVRQEVCDSLLSERSMFRVVKSERDRIVGFVGFLPLELVRCDLWRRFHHRLLYSWKLFIDTLNSLFQITDQL